MNSAPPTTALPTNGGHWFKRFWHLLVRAGVAWDRDKVMRLSASTAMYTLLSLSALLVISIQMLALIFSEESATRQVRQQVDGFLGPVGGQAVAGMITNSMKSGAGIIPTLLSAGLLLFTASGVFNELRDSLDTIWGIVPKTGRGIWAILRERFVSVLMVFAIGILLLSSQAISIVLTVMSEYALGATRWESVAIDLIVSTIIIAVLFAILFRVLPEARLGWRDVIFGSVVTAVLFKMGQYLQALYFTYGSTASAYGAAGSFMVVLLWVYYSCWIFFYGAELIKERVQSLGRQIEPTADAERVKLADIVPRVMNR